VSGPEGGLVGMRARWRGEARPFGLAARNAVGLCRFHAADKLRPVTEELVAWEKYLLTLIFSHKQPLSSAWKGRSHKHTATHKSRETVNGPQVTHEADTAATMPTWRLYPQPANVSVHADSPKVEPPHMCDETRPVETTGADIFTFVLSF